MMLGLKEVTISKKLGLGIGVVVVLMVVTTLFSLNSLNTLATQTEMLYRHPLAVSNAVRDIKVDIIAIHRSMKDVVMARDTQLREDAIVKVAANEVHAEGAFVIVDKQFLGDKSKIEQLHNLFVQWRPIREEVIAHVNNGEYQMAAAITTGKGARHVEDLLEKMDVVITFATSKANTFYLNAQKMRDSTIWSTLLLQFGIIVVAVVVGVMISRSIVIPLHATQEIVDQMVYGDLTKSIVVDSRSDEISKLVSSFNSLADMMRMMLLEMRSLGETASTTSSEVASASKQQASGAAQQAASVSQTTSTMEELASTAQSISRNATTIAQQSEQLNDETQHTTQSLMMATATMVSIGNATKESDQTILDLGENAQSIGKVIETISAFADETKMLSVNASIEASRAGEAGGAFAVVAEEIRALSTKVIRATASIRKVLVHIQDSAEKAVAATRENSDRMQQGNQAIEVIDEKLKRVYTLINSTSELSKQIQLATSQQTSASEQIVSSMKEVETVAKQSALEANQSTDSALELSELVKKLQKNLELFKLE